MNIKKLEFQKVTPIINGEIQNEHYYTSNYDMHCTIFIITPVLEDSFKVEFFTTYWYRSTLEKAKESAQKHFDEFINSYIEI